MFNFVFLPILIKDLWCMYFKQSVVSPEIRQSFLRLNITSFGFHPQYTLLLKNKNKQLLKNNEGTLQNIISLFKYQCHGLGGCDKLVFKIELCELQYDCSHSIVNRGRNTPRVCCSPVDLLNFNRIQNFLRKNKARLVMSAMPDSVIKRIMLFSRWKV